MIFPTIQWDREKALERHRALECIIKGIFPKEASEAVKNGVTFMIQDPEQRRGI